MSRAVATANIFLSLHAAADGSAPEWINLLPSGVITTQDGRGPYTVSDMAALASASLQEAGGKLPVDENHATDFAAPKGAPSPARGWIVDLQARADGLWGLVQWGAAGKQLFAEQAYRGISPVFEHDKSNRVLRVLRASLTNTPNLRGLTALHSQGDDMDLLADLRKASGMPDTADAAAVVAKVQELNGAAGKAAQSAQHIASIAKAAGVKEDAAPDVVLNAISTLATDAAKNKSGDATTITALQSELTNVTTSLNALQSQVSKERATNFVDAAIKAGRVGVKPLRDHYIEQHAKDSARVEKEINSFPTVALEMPRGGAAHAVASDADPVAIAAQAQAYQKKMAEQGIVVDIAAAVHAVTQQKQEKTS